MGYFSNHKKLMYSGFSLILLFSFLFYFLLTCCFVSNCQAGGPKYLDEIGSSLSRDLKNRYYNSITDIHSIQLVQKWAFVGFTAPSNRQDDKILRLNALMEKKGAHDYKLLELTGEGMTTDCLKIYNIPYNTAMRLIDKGQINKQKPVLNFLHNERPGYLYKVIRTSGKWIMAKWYKPKNKTEGYTLLESDKGRYTILFFMYGSINEGYFERYNVPENDIDNLMSEVD